MHYKKGDVVLIKFPFTDLKQSKKRPVLLVQDANDLGDFVCFQITSNSRQVNTSKIEDNHIKSGELKLKSYIKYDKCFTLNVQTIDKKLASVNTTYMHKVKNWFCEEIF
ncbi:MAG: type II toxin-antitoxin system PemK/MazF family toxin [Campylobacterota bacterium]|nr:type II toxin-antitoxin system PemK/MazF family toxin [Campylobacterota bacterium]